MLLLAGRQGAASLDMDPVSILDFSILYFRFLSKRQVLFSKLR